MIWFVLIGTGTLGAVLRLLLERRFMPGPITTQNPWRGWPLGILLANLSGTLLLGLAIGYAQRHAISLHPAQLHDPGWQFNDALGIWVLAIGLCGSLSTVSTLFVGAIALGKQQRSRGWCYLISTIFLGVAVGLTGVIVGTQLG